MAGRFGVVVERLRAVAGDLEDVSAAMKAVLGSLDGQLAGLGSAPWGDDGLGQSFAGGAGGYVAQRDWVAGSVAAKTGLLDGYAGWLRAAANTFEASDS